MIIQSQKVVMPNESTPISLQCIPDHVSINLFQFCATLSTHGSQRRVPEVGTPDRAGNPRTEFQCTPGHIFPVRFQVQSPARKTRLPDLPVKVRLRRFAISEAPYASSGSFGTFLKSGPLASHPPDQMVKTLSLIPPHTTEPIMEAGDVPAAGGWGHSHEVREELDQPTTPFDHWPEQVRTRSSSTKHHDCSIPT